MSFNFDLNKIKNSKVKLSDSDIKDLRHLYNDDSLNWEPPFTMDGFYFLDPTVNMFDDSWNLVKDDVKTISFQFDVSQEDMKVNVTNGSLKFVANKDGSIAA
ncbi:hypothetical protein [Lentilactobacillus parakefiri]|uniref:Uncharacterized protein n=1 Tax=Lentilactobacillus parakefiri TaxID=152332 RepID=A0A224VAZ1_9LACO|nr:hypothetical protein [Lentilactobacillus parakefiri]KRL58936.1 hypothetical protein FD08_GL003308 [Lentilactobacillus parakefiri DSM 10551]PAL00273.1 hypothetical protein B8W96_07235 [Lentilactobacillus parakefiri]TDG90670.1 hypothetical protein C5L28_000385 [Lentilactobacillus parakefiri]GAW70949.1 hypothetical protein LPKJCM_00018 [Lentilactobacillus parakefiri]